MQRTTGLLSRPYARAPSRGEMRQFGQASSCEPGQILNKFVLDRVQAVYGRQCDISPAALDGPPHGCHSRQPTGESENLRGGRAAQSFILVECGVSSFSFDHVSEQPTEYGGIDKAAIHALATGRAVDVRGIAHQEEAPFPVGVG